MKNLQRIYITILALTSCFVMLAGGGVTAASLQSCKDPQTPGIIAEDAEVIIDGACTTVQAHTTNGTVGIACLLSEEAAKLAELVTHAKGVDAGTGDVKCITIPGYDQSICASPKVLAQAILVVSAQRSANDAGSK